MSFFGKSVDGAGGSDSSGDATPTPRTPTNEVFPPNGGLTPSPHQSHSRHFNIHSDGASRQNRRNIWEDANRPLPNTLPHLVFPESPRSPRNDAISAQPKAPARPTQIPFVLGTPTRPRVEMSEPDGSDWYAGLEMLQLKDSILKMSSDVPKPRQQSAFPYNTSGNMSTQPTTQSSSQALHESIWSSYGTQTPSNGTPRNGGDLPMDHPFVPFSAPRPARVDLNSGLRSRALSETSYNTSTELHQAQRRFASQPNPTIPMRMGQSQHNNLHYRNLTSKPRLSPDARHQNRSRAIDASPASQLQRRQPGSVHTLL
ncbi:hypothetical protein NLG97_g8007 [Lecanicillium saksenae]|uniref:Uncharacterized protein n=1 Tax=Lecanicillium saksenae TaxID=468837 RepID=A0ACC1QN60_9HYPO|nr:hypothetical protein NLG97_g8007 [Lecanicillium saksenae]